MRNLLLLIFFTTIYSSIVLGSDAMVKLATAAASSSAAAQNKLGKEAAAAINLGSSSAGFQAGSPPTPAVAVTTHQPSQLKIDCKKTRDALIKACEVFEKAEADFEQARDKLRDDRRKNGCGNKERQRVGTYMFTIKHCNGLTYYFEMNPTDSLHTLSPMLAEKANETNTEYAHWQTFHFYLSRNHRINSRCKCDDLFSTKDIILWSSNGEGWWPPDRNKTRKKFELATTETNNRK